MASEGCEKQEMIYKECALTYRYYLDWRFKILTRHAVVVSATFFAVKYVIESELIGNSYAALPLVLFSLVSMAFYRMDNRHEDLAHTAAGIAGKIEEKMMSASSNTESNNGHPGFFYYQAHNRPKFFTHSMMFRFIYLGSAFIGILGAGVVLCNT